MDKDKISQPLKEALRKLAREKAGSSTTKEEDLDSLMNKMLDSLSIEETAKLDAIVERLDSREDTEEEERNTLLRNALGIRTEEDIKAEEQARKDNIRAYRERYRGLTDEQKIEEAFGIEIDPNKESTKTVDIYNQLTGELQPMTRLQFIKHIELLKSKGIVEKKESKE